MAKIMRYDEHEIERAFFLDTQGDWERFVKEVLKSYEGKP